jgi:hypothetical protein
MAKAGTKPKRKPKTTTSDKEQSERFKETARKLGADESGGEFEASFRKIVQVKNTRRSG